MITEYEVSDISFCPILIKTKLINKQKDLKVIRNKFENNEILDSRECSLLIAFPLFELGESEDAIVEEMCINIAQKGDCIPDDELDGIIIGMYLNIVEYVDVEKQVVIIYAVVNNYLKTIPVEDIREYEKDLFLFLDESHPDILASIRDTKELTAENEKALKEVLKAFAEKFMQQK